MAMLVVFALTVVTSVATSHAMRMDTSASEVAHASHMMAGTMAAGDMAAGDMAERKSCGDHQSCDPASADLCAFVCAGLLNYLYPEQKSPLFIQQASDHYSPAATIVRSHDPGRNERPPISNLH